jgi:hypothetical protein
MDRLPEDISFLSEDDIDLIKIDVMFKITNIKNDLKSFETDDGDWEQRARCAQAFLSKDFNRLCAEQARRKRAVKEQNKMIHAKEKASAYQIFIELALEAFDPKVVSELLRQARLRSESGDA